jgi:hypothetical protein
VCRDDYTWTNLVLGLGLRNRHRGILSSDATWNPEDVRKSLRINCTENTENVNSFTLRQSHDEAKCDAVETETNLNPANEVL